MEATVKLSLYMFMFIYSYILICTESALHQHDLFSHNVTDVCILSVTK